MTQTRALLLTDVVDSTRLSTKLGDAAMAAVWAAHDRAARDLLPAWRGREIDKADGMLLLFDHAADAVGYALAYHQALCELPVALKARAGLHVGPVVLLENSDEDVARGAKRLEVEGLAKSIAARVMSLAAGGQTLISDEARCALGEGAWALWSHGHWMLKGLAAPIELYEIGPDENVFSTPEDGEKAYRVARIGDQWLPLRQIPNNLPQQITSFIGRDVEHREVCAALEASRLVTLLGMGGLGKTRLSLRVAAEVMVRFPDGVWFLNLAPIRDPALLVGQAAQVLGVREEPDRPLVETLCASLKPRRTLLIFDNCEHLIQASAEVIDTILRATSQVRILASSREALRVPGERSYPLLPLPVPEHGVGLEALSRSAAVRLFVERAQGHKPTFTLTGRDAPAVAELVTRLEGIPLALELAAARVRAMSVADINARLKDRYKLLICGDRVLLERQQTLRALVDWSYDLLDDSERLVMNRLALFVGGFDLDAAEKVCGSDPIEPSDVLDLLSSLVEKSLLMTDERAGGTRYRMLETIRDYAREKLVDTGASASTAASHCQHYFVLAKAIRKGVRGANIAEWIERAEADLDNIRAAIALGLDGGVDPLIPVKIAVAMQTFWILRGYCTEGRAVVRAALAQPAIRASDIAQAHALYVGAALALMQSDYLEARSMLEACLELRRRAGDPANIAGALSTLSLAQFDTGDTQAAREGEREALALFRQCGDRIGEATVLLHLAQIAQFVGDEAEALARLEESRAIARDICHHEIEGECELAFGQVAFDYGDQARAREHFNRSLAICRGAADKRTEANASWWLAKVDLEDGLLVAAAPRLANALRSFRAFEMRRELVGCLEDHATLVQARGEACTAVRFAAVAATSRHRFNLVRSSRAEQRWKAQLDSLRRATTSAAFEIAWNEGQTWLFDHAVRMAVSKPGESLAD